MKAIAKLAYRNQYDDAMFPCNDKCRVYVSCLSYSQCGYITLETIVTIE